MIDLLESVLKPVLIFFSGLAIVVGRFYIIRRSIIVYGLTKKEANKISRYIMLGGRSKYVPPQISLLVIPCIWGGLFMVLSATFFSGIVDEFLFTMSGSVYVFILLNYVFMLSASYYFGFEGDVQKMIKAAEGGSYLEFLYKNATYSLTNVPSWLGRLSGTLWWFACSVAILATLYSLSIAFFPF